MIFDNCNYKDLDILKEKAKRSLPPVPTYKLGEEVKHGIKFWGHKLKDKKANLTYLFICPKCGELWRSTISKVLNAKARSCGCKKK